MAFLSTCKKIVDASANVVKMYTTNTMASDKNEAEEPTIVCSSHKKRPAPREHST